MSLSVAERRHGRGALCRAILDALPEWFALPEAVEEYVAGVADQPMFALAPESGGAPVGFLSLRFQTDHAAEAYVLGIRREWHRRGGGAALFDAAAAFARHHGARFLTVKTIAASHPDPHYAATRRFYEAIGFLALEEFPTLWGPGVPCLLMVRPL